MESKHDYKGTVNIQLKAINLLTNIINLKHIMYI